MLFGYTLSAEVTQGVFTLSPYANIVTLNEVEGSHWVSGLPRGFFDYAKAPLRMTERRRDSSTALTLNSG